MYWGIQIPRPSSLEFPKPLLTPDVVDVCALCGRRASRLEPHNTGFVRDGNRLAFLQIRSVSGFNTAITRPPAESPRARSRQT